jgi:hypothetical protein
MFECNGPCTHTQIREVCVLGVRVCAYIHSLRKQRAIYERERERERDEAKQKEITNSDTSCVFYFTCLCARAGGNTRATNWLLLTQDQTARSESGRPTACLQTTWTMDPISEQIEADDLKDILLQTHHSPQLITY